MKTAAYRYDDEGRIIDSKLDSSAVPLPPVLPDEAVPTPPPREGSTEQVSEGEVLYNRLWPLPSSWSWNVDSANDS